MSPSSKPPAQDPLQNLLEDAETAQIVATAEKCRPCVLDQKLSVRPSGLVQLAAQYDHRGELASESACHAKINNIMSCATA
jgi:hypothetical protein